MLMEDEYRKYLFEHIHNVKKAYDWIKENISDYAMDISDIYLHDNSKFVPEEFDAYANYFYGDKTEDVIEAFDYAWNKHQKSNPHHWQYWILINDDDCDRYLDMPIEYIIEMICDWWSFSWVKGNLYEIFNWYDSHKEKIQISNKTRRIVEDILNQIKDKLDERGIINE